MTDTTDLHWFKSSHSGSEGDDCVEVAVTAPTAVHVRDSKRRHDARLTLSPAAWSAFLT
ncbi:DUF397 domain-containing protein, partial [Streptomyces alkaliphilus]